MCPQEHGDYKICFDNSFSYLSSKTVYFEILNENEDEDYDELRDIFGDDEEVDAEYYEVSVAEIEVGCNFFLDRLKFFCGWVAIFVCGWVAIFFVGGLQFFCYNVWDGWV